MIHSFEILDKNATRYPPFINIANFPQKLEFKAGLNIVVGPNGSGKSALLRFIARLLHCEKGIQNITKESCEAIQYLDASGKNTIDGFFLNHTGAPCAYYSAENFGISKKYSTGGVASRVLSNLFSGQLNPLDLKNEKRPRIKSILEGDGSFEKGNKVYIIDEPERGLCAENMVKLCDSLGNFTHYSEYLEGAGQNPDTQVILASNHPFITCLAGANVVELEKQYFAKMSAIYKSVCKFISK